VTIGLQQNKIHRLLQGQLVASFYIPIRMPKWCFVIDPRRRTSTHILLLIPEVFTDGATKVTTFHFKTVVSKHYIQWTTSFRI